MGSDWRSANFSKMCKCGVCGKDFFIPVVGYWVYKRENHLKDGNEIYFCGWNCMRKFEKEYEEKKAKKLEERKKRMRKY